MEKQHLHLLINEEIYRIGGDEVLSATAEESNTEEVKVEVKEDATDDATLVAEPAPEPIVPKEEKLVEQPATPKSTQDSPEIPTRKKEVPKEISLAIFHSSTNLAEMELLQKIIDACKVPTEDYTIFENGFDQSVQFKKALVFVEEAKGFYTPIPYKNSHFLCSKPLAMLAQDQQEKGKLWVALQKFVLS